MGGLGDRPVVALVGGRGLVEQARQILDVGGHRFGLGQHSPHDGRGVAVLADGVDIDGEPRHLVGQPGHRRRAALHIPVGGTDLLAQYLGSPSESVQAVRR